MGSALAFALALADAHALGLGGLRVQSALNQPFIGEIALFDVNPNQLDTVKVQIASAEEFSKAGSERYHYLTGLRFSPQVSPRGETVIRISSREPIREPYMDFLVEATWPSGRLVKGFTALLDPPVTDGRQPSRIEPPAVQSRASSGGGRTGSGSSEAFSSRPKKPAQAPSQPAPTSTAVSGSAAGFPKYIGPVPRGGGLWRLSTKYAPAGATAAQTAMALYRNNQDAFVNGDINRLRLGKTLVIPNAAELFVLGPEAADREFAAALRGEQVRRTPIADTSPASGPEPEPRLKIAGAAPEGGKPGAIGGSGTESPGAVQEELLLVREAGESTRQETAELRNRIRELEAQLGEIQKLLQLRNAELARIQRMLEPVTQSVPTGSPSSIADIPAASGGLSAASSAEGDGTTSEAADRALLERALAALGAIDVSEGGQALDAPAGDARPDGPVLDDGAVGIPGAAESAIAAVGAPEARMQEAQVIAPETAAPDSTAAPSEPSRRTGSALPPPWDDLLAPLAGALGVMVLGIGALAWVRVRRRRASEESYLEPESIEPTLGAEDVFSHQAGGEVESSAFATGSADPGGLEGAPLSSPSVFSTVSRSQAESDEADVLSEADIYVAYGRYREAEDLLREEIQRSPDRIDLKYKLAETYHGAKNYPALDGLMSEMTAAGEDRLYPERWQRLVDLAKAIEGLDRADSGMKPPVPGAVPAATRSAGGSSLFSLESAEITDPAAGGDRPGAQGDAPGSGVDPSRQDVPVLRSSRPAPPVDDDLEPLSLDLDVLLHSLEPDDRPEPSGMDAPLDADDGDLFGAVSDLELTIEDLRSASDVDLDAFVDSMHPPGRGGGESLSQDGAVASAGIGAPKLRAVSSDGARVPDDEALGGFDEEGSSDLLSSQWQMDSGLWDETATKLDLARAYVEMGDQDAAKGILEEVVDEGSEEQRGEAAQMLRAIG
jgi:pilus assembly protein FimV